MTDADHVGVRKPVPMGVQKCSRCGRRWRGQIDVWNFELKDNRLVGVICPDCQTPEELNDAEIYQAKLDYLGIGADGLIVEEPKTTHAHYGELTRDLWERTRTAIGKVGERAVANDESFDLDNIVQSVEDDLPPGYGASTQGPETRRDVIAEMALDLLMGVSYDDDDGAS